MKKYTTRLAENHEGERIRQLVDLDEDDFPDVKWDKINPWWVVILDEDEIIGCAQMILSNPIAQVEFLCLDDKLSVTQKAYAIKILTKFIGERMREDGISIGRSMIPHSMKQWKKVVKRKWGTHLFDGSAFVMRF